MVKVVLFGMPGAGKGTQAKKLSSWLEVPHISTGDIYREEMAKHSELGEQVRMIMESGNLCPDDLTNQIIENKIKSLDGFILDGYPRTVAQAKWFDDFCKRNKIEIDGFFEIQVFEGTARERVKKRLLEQNRPEDASTESIEKRFEAYKRDTVPCIDYYESKGELNTIIGDYEIEEVFYSFQFMVQLAYNTRHCNIKINIEGDIDEDQIWIRKQ